MRVEIIIPKNWYDPVYYKTLETVNIMGFTIPCGFEFDGASVPRILWSIFPPIGRYTSAALLHDYLLTTSDKSWGECTSFFNKELKQLKISTWRRVLMVAGVTMHGYFKKKRSHK